MAEIGKTLDQKMNRRPGGGGEGEGEGEGKGKEGKGGSSWSPPDLEMPTKSSVSDRFRNFCSGKMPGSGIFVHF